MALKRIYYSLTETSRQDDPDNPGVYDIFYETQESIWDDEAKTLTKSTGSDRYTGGYSGAPEPPGGYSWPADVPVDAYTVPAAGMPGHVAGRQGQYTTIYHDQAGDVLREYSPVCDLRVFNLVGRAPENGSATGAVEFNASTSAAWVSASLTNQGSGPFSPGTPLVQVAPGRLAIQQVPPGTYALSVEDERQCAVGFNPLLLVTVPLAPPPVVRGCTDQEASNYNALATENDGTCRYAPRWLGLWHPDGIQATLPATSATSAYVSGEVWAGFPPGHELAAGRPMALVATVRATVSPRTGLATFNLAPYLRGTVGSLQTDGGRRLDRNAATADSEDLFTGFRLWVGGQIRASGYALNSSLSEVDLERHRTQNLPLSPFGRVLPRWAGYPVRYSGMGADATGRYGVLGVGEFAGAGDSFVSTVTLPCPRHGLPVCWLAPEGGYGYWVFSGNHSYGDDIAEGQTYSEAGTGELRLSQREGSRRTIEASSGVFSRQSFADGLRTLRRAAQAWYQPGGVGTAWVPIVLRSGSFPAYREGRRRYEVTIQFTEAGAVAVQGQ